MLPALLSASTTVIMIGFIFIADPTLNSADKMWVKIVVGIMVLAMMACLWLIRIEEREKRTRDQALMIYIMAIGIKLGVNIEELKKARDMLDKIDEIGKKG